MVADNHCTAAEYHRDRTVRGAVVIVVDMVARREERSRRSEEVVVHMVGAGTRSLAEAEKHSVAAGTRWVVVETHWVEASQTGPV